MQNQGFQISQIYDSLGIKNSARVIRNSFKTVAREFNLTRANCPTHPSFVTVKKLNELKKKGLIFFGGFSGEVQIGFVALEKADAILYYMEKLAVLPNHRHHGYGRGLVEFAIEHVKKQNAAKISIGTIDEQTVLKEWYKKLGFKEVSTKKFLRLPFTVCYMEIKI
jgi:diamine N-acetyltransferase